MIRVRIKIRLQKTTRTMTFLEIGSMVPKIAIQPKKIYKVGNTIQGLLKTLPTQTLTKEITGLLIDSIIFLIKWASRRRLEDTKQHKFHRH